MLEVCLEIDVLKHQLHIHVYQYSYWIDFHKIMLKLLTKSMFVNVRQLELTVF